MRSRIGAAFAIAVALTSTEAAADGNALLTQCQLVLKVVDGGRVDRTTDMVGAGQCLGMVEGVRNTLTILNTGLPGDYRVCFPDDGISNGQAARIVVKFLKEHPEILNKDSTFLSMLAFKQAYPCKG